MNVQILRKIGLTDTEIKVYLSLLSVGATSIGKILKDSGVYRKNAYDALEKLITKGLVTYVIENKIRYFQPKDPENLFRYLEERRSEITENEQELKKTMPELKERFGSLRPEIESEIYRGMDGIKTILNKCLDYEEVLMIGATGDVEDRMPYFWPLYNKKREKLGCKWKLLLVYEARKRKITKSKHYEYKILPKTLSGLNVIYIYGDYVANIMWLEKPIAFVTKHEMLAENYRKYFNFLWESV